MELKGKKNKTKNILYSFKYAFEGLFFALRHERNIKIESFVALLVIIAGFILKVSLNEWTILLICISMVISLELVNTSMEETVDLATDEINPGAKKSKDLAAGAVLFASLISAIIGIIIFLPKIIDLF